MTWAAARAGEGLENRGLARVERRRRQRRLDRAVVAGLLRRRLGEAGQPLGLAALRLLLPLLRLGGVARAALGRQPLDELLQVTRLRRKLRLAVAAFLGAVLRLALQHGLALDQRGEAILLRLEVEALGLVARLGLGDLPAQHGERGDLLAQRARLDLERRYRSEEHTSELQSRLHLVCRLLLEKKKNQ